MFNQFRPALLGAVIFGSLAFAGTASAQVSFTGSYNPNQIALGSSTTVTLSVPNATVTALSAGTFNYTFPAGNWNYTGGSGCTGTINSNGGSSTVTLSNLAVNAGATCVLNFSFRPNNAGIYPLSPSTLSYAGADGASPKPLTAGANPTLTVTAPVPTMSEWALILFGTVLAGGAALYVQRRRPVA
ncbi:IPTL-CTERM sorting domain-containing protein [Brevundimonas sp. NIBR11]|uniref:IPTL-CTERM sorting domain-containing protein n=1 Tax=Brevundimonas sp. NIBR11 TaxID=3015999 RepID=UPI0022F01C52|nr:IPTL-CTERM sorting domain-containing protein [Brevundimonas sp. NIBR11]WGM32912.1 hypothetical protein KKHFBJBL_03168 [Brevundimonas sp. NIBR11]